MAAVFRDDQFHPIRGSTTHVAGGLTKAGRARCSSTRSTTSTCSILVDRLAAVSGRSVRFPRSRRHRRRGHGRARRSRAARSAPGVGVARQLVAPEPAARRDFAQHRHRVVEGTTVRPVSWSDTDGPPTRSRVDALRRGRRPAHRRPKNPDGASCTAVRDNVPPIPTSTSRSRAHAWWPRSTNRAALEASVRARRRAEAAEQTHTPAAAPSCAAPTRGNVVFECDTRPGHVPPSACIEDGDPVAISTLIPPPPSATAAGLAVVPCSSREASPRDCSRRLRNACGSWGSSTFWAHARDHRRELLPRAGFIVSATVLSPPRHRRAPPPRHIVTGS